MRNEETLGLKKTVYANYFIWSLPRISNTYHEYLKSLPSSDIFLIFLVIVNYFYEMFLLHLMIVYSL